VIVFGEDQVIAVQSTVDGLEIENPYYIEFDPRNVLEIPKKVSYRAAEPLVVNFTPY